MENFKKILLNIGGVVLLVLLLFIFTGDPGRLVNPEVSGGQQPQAGESTHDVHGTYTVVDVVDGDTVKLKIDGSTESVRLIGIDTPETVHPSKPVECFGKEASSKAKDVLSGEVVILETDKSQGVRDKYDRLLGYLILPDGTNFNKMMIEEGYAYEYTYSTPYKYQQEFQKAEKHARANKLGLWADGACDVEKVGGRVNSEADENTARDNDVKVDQSGDVEYECGYNAYNCSDFSSHREAQSVYDTCEGDIHRLDRDKDGIACESLR
jgi:micrococcal nuclease